MRNNPISFTSSNKGQTLIEVLVVAGILALMLTGIMSIVTLTVSHNRKVKNRTVAVRLAQEGVDWVRSQRDSLGWYTFASGMQSAGTYQLCINDTTVTWKSINHHAACSSTFTVGSVQYKRDLTLQYVNDNQFSASVVVTWDESGNSVTTDIQTTLVNIPN